MALESPLAQKCSFFSHLTVGNLTAEAVSHLRAPLGTMALKSSEKYFLVTQEGRDRWQLSGEKQTGAPTLRQVDSISELPGASEIIALLYRKGLSHVTPSQPAAVPALETRLPGDAPLAVLQASAQQLVLWHQHEHAGAHPFFSCWVRVNYDSYSPPPPGHSLP